MGTPRCVLRLELSTHSNDNAVSMDINYTTLQLVCSDHMYTTNIDKY